MKVEVKERPILFSGQMVRAILDGRKTQTRRVVRPQPDFISPADGLPYPYVEHQFIRDNKIVTLQGPEGMPNSRFVGKPIRSPYGTVGDRLWVRETWRVFGGREYEYQQSKAAVQYRADETEFEQKDWRPSIFMFRWASRITLEITNIRVERLHQMTQADIHAEGGPDHSMQAANIGTKDAEYLLDYSWFSHLWNKINGKKHPWESNPRVWVIEFLKATT
jgi:hypothetical protein